VAAVQGLRKRFHLAAPEPQLVETVLGLISDSLDAWRTRQVRLLAGATAGMHADGDARPLLAPGEGGRDGGLIGTARDAAFAAACMCAWLNRLDLIAAPHPHPHPAQYDYYQRVLNGIL
jgi:hypothetical protein